MLTLSFRINLILNLKSLDWIIGLQSIIPQMAIKFSTNDYLIKHTNNSKWTNGFIAGFLDGTFLGPILAIQSFRQMNSIITYKECFSLLRNNYSRFFHLPLPMAMRNAVYTSFLFGAYNPVKSILFNENKKINFLDNLLITSIVNIPAVLLCSGFDVIRAQQITKFLENKNVNSFSIAKNIFKSNGILGFYRGIGSLYINFAFRFPLTFSMYQY